MDRDKKTIAAIATAPGDGAIAIIRISGKDSLQIANSIFSGPVLEYKTHSAHYGAILSKNNKKIDHVLILPMLGPNSYTGEDTVEIHTHGGAVITKMVLKRVFDKGAVPANPGEFSFRAFKNGKIDLAQAEAVQKLIGAKNELAIKTAENQLAGHLSAAIQGFQKKITHIAAIIEAWVDFPEEDLEFASFDSIISSIEDIIKQMELLKNTFERGRIYHEGISICLVGSPNVGKSSLMNALLRKDRAIVTPIAGTTRDILIEDLYLCNLHCKIQDTAGIRNTEEIIEKEGIKRSIEAMEKADIVLLILDATRELNDYEKNLISSRPLDKTVIIYNKIDLNKPTISDSNNTIFTSAVTNQGIEKLITYIESLILDQGPDQKEGNILTEIRHKKALSSAIDALKLVSDGLKNKISPEFVASDIRYSLNRLGQIIGIDVTEDILTEIFSTFCLGK